MAVRRLMNDDGREPCQLPFIGKVFWRDIVAVKIYFTAANATTVGGSRKKRDIGNIADFSPYSAVAARVLLLDKPQSMLREGGESLSVVGTVVNIGNPNAIKSVPDARR